MHPEQQNPAWSSRNVEHLHHSTEEKESKADKTLARMQRKQHRLLAKNQCAVALMGEKARERENSENRPSWNFNSEDWRVRLRNGVSSSICSSSSFPFKFHVCFAVCFLCVLFASQRQVLLGISLMFFVFLFLFPLSPIAKKANKRKHDLCREGKRKSKEWMVVQRRWLHWNEKEQNLSRAEKISILIDPEEKEARRVVFPISSSLFLVFSFQKFHHLLCSVFSKWSRYFLVGCFRLWPTTILSVRLRVFALFVFDHSGRFHHSPMDFESAEWSRTELVDPWFLDKSAQTLRSCYELDCLYYLHLVIHFSFHFCHYPCFCQSIFTSAYTFPLRGFWQSLGHHRYMVALAFPF